MLRLKEQVKQKQSGGQVQTSVSTDTAAVCRLTSDIVELNGETSIKKVVKITATRDNPLLFYIYISPDDGYYRGGEFKFIFTASVNYPYEPPKVKCETKTYHPNIDLDGNVCLNILREDWKPVLKLVQIVFGLIHLFLEPNADDPLNKRAAEILVKNPTLFEQYVRQSIAGGNVDGTHFPGNRRS